MFRCGKTLLALALLMTIPVAVSAQTPDNPPAPSSPAQPASQPPPTVELLKPEQLEALVAPIALYPDELLANVLAASTYPLEVVQADRWLKARKTLKGDALKKEVEKQSWDDSVKALASTADVISMMSDKIDWTKNLGDAVLAQQPDVMDAIQRLRSKAYDNKKLVTTKQQKVRVQTQESKQAIVIESADPNTMYVPYYDPAAVYGTWPYADYQPYYFGYPPYIGAGVIAAGHALARPWPGMALWALMVLSSSIAPIKPRRLPSMTGICSIKPRSPRKSVSLVSSKTVRSLSVCAVCHARKLKLRPPKSSRSTPATGCVGNTIELPCATAPRSRISARR